MDAPKAEEHRGKFKKANKDFLKEDYIQTVESFFILIFSLELKANPRA